MKKKRIIILILQIVLILGSVYMLSNYTKNQVKPTEVYVYSRNISDVSNALTESDIKKVVIPKSAVTKDFALNKDEIINMHVDSKVKEGQYIYKNQLITLEEVDIFETLDMSMYRKISLPISFVDGFSGNVKRGDKIDLVFTGKGSKTAEDGRGQQDFNYSKVFLQDILVYSVNTDDGYKFIDHSDYTINNYDDKEEISVSGKQKIETITLAVTLEDAEEIEARTNTGKVRFLGRFEGSKSYNTLGYVLGDYEKVFSGQGFAETDRIIIEEDDFDIINLEDIESNDKIENIVKP